jgi:dolichol kinase
VRRDPSFAVVLAPLLAVMAIAFFTRMRRKPSWLFVFLFLPLLVNAALLHQGIDVHTVVLLAVGAYLVGHRIRQLLWPKLEAMAASDRALLRRKWLRPLAIAFPLGVLWERMPTLTVLGVTLAVFAVSEALRFRARYHRFPLPYRQSERERISSMVMFLLGAFVTLAFFPTEIASLAVLFLIFGDLLAWCIGQTVGGPGFLDKTWAGTAACLLTCVTLVSLYSSLGLVPLPVGLLGAVCATAVKPRSGRQLRHAGLDAIAMALVWFSLGTTDRTRVAMRLAFHGQDAVVTGGAGHRPGTGRGALPLGCAGGSRRHERRAAPGQTRLEPPATRSYRLSRREVQKRSRTDRGP